MSKKLLLMLVMACVLIAVTAQINAQDYPVLWEDHFDDDDLPALKNVGWIYYPEQDIQGQTVEQRDGALFIEAGSYGGLVGAGVVETNGVPEIIWDEDGNPNDATVDTILQDIWSSPNQILSFQVNFARFTQSQFLVGARMPMDTTRGDADPTEADAYVMVISPLENYVVVAKYTGQYAALYPNTWTYLSEPAAFEFDQGVFYQVKWYLNEGDIMVNVWEGEEADEPEEWLITTVDPEPRVTGTFNMFGVFMASPPAEGQGDQAILDNIVVRSSIPVTGVDKDVKSVVDFRLAQNYPNPFNPATTISFTLDKSGFTSLTIYNLKGQAIRTLVNQNMPAGSCSFDWNGADNLGNTVSSGIYIYQLTSGNQKISKRMVLMK